MLVELSVLSSGFSFSNSNYNYDNTNTTISSHLCDIFSINPANMAKNNKFKRALVIVNYECDPLNAKAMKRINNLYEKIYTIENLKLADLIARKGKMTQPGIKMHDKSCVENIYKLHEMLKNKTYKTS